MGQVKGLERIPRETAGSGHAGPTTPLEVQCPESEGGVGDSEMLEQTATEGETQDRNPATTTDTDTWARTIPSTKRAATEVSG